MTDYTKSYYRIREVAAMFDLPAHTLRFWESEFPQLSPARTSTGLRRYSPQDIEVIKAIKNLLYVKGLRIDAAKAVLQDANKHLRKPKCDSCVEAQILLQRIRKMSEDNYRCVNLIDAVIDWVGKKDEKGGG